VRGQANRGGGEWLSCFWKPGIVERVMCGRIVMVEKPVVVLPLVWTFTPNALLRSHKHHG
jgi:hypothetical protein